MCCVVDIAKSLQQIIGSISSHDNLAHDVIYSNLNYSVIARLVTFKVHTGRGFALLVLVHSSSTSTTPVYVVGVFE